MQSRLLRHTRLNSAVSGILLCGAMITYPSQVNAQQSKADTISACEEAARLLEDDDIDAALEEAEWCREGLQQMKQSQTLAVFPDEVNGYEGGEVTNEGVLGMVTMGRQYRKGSQEIDLQLVNGGIAGLGSIGQLINSLGSLAGVENEKINDPSCKIYEVDDDYDFGAIDPLDLAQDLYENEKT